MNEQPRWEPGTPWEPARPPAPPRPPAAARRPEAGPRYRPEAGVHWAGQTETRGLDGADGNERLTAMTGAVLLVLLAAEGFTILSLRQLLTLHFFIGMLLLGPVALKAGSTMYRFIRYYAGSAPYRRKGPPAPLLRLLGPVIIASTAVVFGTGIALAVTGPAGRQPWLFLHKASFVIWVSAMTIHVLAYLPRLPRLIASEAAGETEGPAPRPGRGYGGRAAAALGGRGLRLALLVASLVAGLVIAMLTVHLAVPWHSAGPR
jgi:hypothetical protein